jgi:hypothetical protein
VAVRQDLHRHSDAGLAPVADAGGGDGVDLNMINQAGRKPAEDVASAGGLRDLQDDVRRAGRRDPPVVGGRTKDGRHDTIQFTRARPESDLELGRGGRHADGLAVRFLGGKTAGQKHGHAALARHLHIAGEFAHQGHKRGTFGILDGGQRHAAVGGIRQRAGEFIQRHLHRGQRRQGIRVVVIARQAEDDAVDADHESRVAMFVKKLDGWFDDHKPVMFCRIDFADIWDDLPPPSWVWFQAVQLQVAMNASCAPK